MIRIAIYIVRQIVSWMVLALAALTLAFLTTQSLRVAPVFVGAGAGFVETVIAIGLVTVPVVGWALTPAFVVAVFSTAGRMAADGELVAFDSSGLNRRWLALGPGALALLVGCLSAWLWLDAAPRSQAMLRSYAVDLAGRALAGRLDRGRFVKPIEGVTFFADAKEEKGVFRGVVIEDVRDPGRSVQFVATKARIAADPSIQALVVHFENGTAFVTSRSQGKSPLSLTFQSLDLKMPFAAELERRLDFLPSLLAVSTPRLKGSPPPGIGLNEWDFALWRRVAGPFGFVILAMLSIGLSFGAAWSRRGVAVAIAVALFLVYHLLCRFAESLMMDDIIDGFTAAMLPVWSVFLALLFLVLWSFRQVIRRQ